MKWFNYISILVIVIGSCKSPTVDTSTQPSLDSCDLVVINEDPKVGMTLSIQLKCNPEISDTVHLLWSGTLADRIYPVALEKGTGNIEIDGAELKHSGVITYQLIDHNHTLRSGSITIGANKPYGLLETYTGPKTIIAGGLEEAMMVAIPLDTFRNVAAIDEIQFGMNTSEKTYDEMIKVRRLNASKKFGSGDKIGKWYLGASVESGNSLEEHIYITPSSAEDFTISATLSTPYADSRTISVISTDFIRDPNGNLISDGTLVNFNFMQGDHLISLYRAPIIGGVARLYFEHPDRPMELDVVAHIANRAKSSPIQLKFDPFIREINASYNKEKRIIQVGPLKGILNQYLPDGFKVTFHIKGNDSNNWKYGMLENGKYELQMSEVLYTPGSYEVNIYVGDQSIPLNIDWK